MKAACGYAIDAKGFDPSTLTYWRRRLAASDRPQRIFEVVREVITETGAVAGKTRARAGLHHPRRRGRPSGHRDPADRPDPPGRPRGARREGCDRHRVHPAGGADRAGLRQAGKPRIAWDDPAARDELASALVGDAVALLAAPDAQVGLEAIDKAGGPAEAVALLALVAGQDVEPAEDSMAPTAGGGSRARPRRTG